jgi:hypothetical protein
VSAWAETCRRVGVSAWAETYRRIGVSAWAETCRRVGVSAEFSGSFFVSAVWTFGEGHFVVIYAPKAAIGLSLGFEWREDKPDLGCFIAPQELGPTGEWFLSRRDSTIVARHEVPGIIRKIAPSQRDD